MWTQKNGQKRSTSIGSVCGNGMDIAENQWWKWVIKPHRTSIENLKQSKTCHCLQQLICVSTCFHFSSPHSHARTFFCSYPIFWICHADVRLGDRWVLGRHLPGSGGMTSRTWWHGGCDELANDQLPVAWSPVINQDSRYGYLMMFEYWQISYTIICCTKAPVSAKTCEAWFIMYIYILCIHVCLLTYYFLLWKDEEGTKPETGGVTPWPAQELEAVYIEAVWYYYCALMEPKAFFFTIKKQHGPYYIYIFRVWILMDFDGFWRILMYFDGLTDFRFLTAWTSPCALKTSAAQVIPRRSAQRELCGCHQIPEVQNKQQKRWSNG